MVLGGYLLGPNDALENGVYTGDARELAKAIPDESVDLIFTDPVYQNTDDYAWLAREATRVLKQGGVALISFGIGYLDDASAAIRGSGLDYRWEMVWYQSNNMQRADTGYCKWSPIRWYEKGRSTPRHPVQDLRNVPIPSGAPPFKWAKPLQLIAYYMDAFSGPGDIVLDPFCGNGGTLLGCKVLGRDYLAFEIDPETAKMARRRVHEMQPLLTPKPQQVQTVLFSGSSGELE